MTIHVVVNKRKEDGTTWKVRREFHSMEYVDVNTIEREESRESDVYSGTDAITAVVEHIFST